MEWAVLVSVTAASLSPGRPWSGFSSEVVGGRMLWVGGALMEEGGAFVGKEFAGMAVGLGDGVLELGVKVVMAGRMRDGEVFGKGGTR